MNSWADVAVPRFNESYVFPALTLKSTATGSLVSLPQNRDIRMYVCGITPYDATHLGHAATYIAFDLVNRYIRSAGQMMHFVENVTDIDDPLLERAIRDGQSWESLATSQIELFKGDMTDLHILPPENFIGAVESIPLVIQAVKIMQNRSAIYELSKDLYFRVKSDSRFGSRAHLSFDEMIEISRQRGGDPDRSGKEDPLDALVWMQQRHGEPGWPSPFGIGRPGWHIECCAIALAYLDKNPSDQFCIDIQGGGSDLQFPHHDISAAQARVLGEKEFARIYMHAGMIGFDGEKMSKSKGNLVLVSTLVSSGVDPMVIRCALLQGHYAQDRMWNQQLLTDAQLFIERMRSALSREEVAPTTDLIENMIHLLSQDLNTPSLFVALELWCHQTESGLQGGCAGELSRAIDALLGIAF